MPKSSPRDQIWILSALSLPYKERVQAMNDIADLMGTSYARVQSIASQLKAKQMADAVVAGYGERRQAYDPKALRGPRHLPDGPSGLRQPSKEDLMAGRARVRPRI